MRKKYLAKVLSNDLNTIYNEPRRYLALRMLALFGERSEPEEPDYHEFTVVGEAGVEAYEFAVGSKLLVECSEDEQGHLRLGRIKVLDEIARNMWLGSP